MLHFGSADPESQRSESTVGGGVGISTDHGQAGNGDPQFRADHVHNALALVADAIEIDAEFLTVALQGLHLSFGYGVLDGQTALIGGHVVIHGGEGQFRVTHTTTTETQAFESLRAGHFMYQMPVDV